MASYAYDALYWLTGETISGESICHAAEWFGCAHHRRHDQLQNLNCWGVRSLS